MDIMDINNNDSVIVRETNKCYDQQIELFHELCNLKKQEIERSPNPNKTVLFTEWIVEFVVDNNGFYRLIMEYAIRKFNMSSNLNIHKYLESIINSTYNIQNDEQNEHYIRLPDEPFELDGVVFNDVIGMQVITTYYILCTKPVINDIKLTKIEYTGDYKEKKCDICWDNITENKFTELNCNHSACSRCVDKIMIENPSCPFCREKIVSVKVYEKKN